MTLGTRTTTIATAAFKGCKKLKSITTCDTLISIAPSAFFGCSSLSSIVLPVSIRQIGNSCFDLCYSLTAIYYKGTKEAWDALDTKNAGLTYANVFCDYKG